MTTLGLTFSNIYQEVSNYLGLGLANVDQNPDAAVARLEKAVALEPRRSRFHSWLGLMYISQTQGKSMLSAMGLARKSKAELEKAVELDPADPDARQALLGYYLNAPGIAGGSMAKAKEQAASLEDPWVREAIEDSVSLPAS